MPKYYSLASIGRTCTCKRAYSLQTPRPPTCERPVTCPSMNHPDEDLEEIQMSLQQFVAASQGLFNEQDANRFVRFVLAGRLVHNKQQNRIFINPQQGTSAPPSQEYEMRRDIDSVVGVTRSLPFSHCMAIFPVAPFRDTLKKDNHITYPISTSTVSC